MEAFKIPFCSISSTNEKGINEKELLDYYEKAGPDYETWSRNFNMHFGYYQKGINPFNREKMLQKMNEEVLQNLNINHISDSCLVDMGCGLGATMRYASSNLKRLQCFGVTIVPWQKMQADELNERAGMHDSIQVMVEDYTKTRFASNSIDHVVAIESSCYASGRNKKDLLQEIQRILKPGGTFVIADGFLKNNRPMSGILRKAYRQLCKSWALSELGNIQDVSEALDDLGFSDVKAKDVSWNVAPSVAHVTFTVIQFLWRQLFFSKTKMNKERWDNLKSPLLTMVLGLHQKHFRYYIIKGTKA